MKKIIKVLVVDDEKLAREELINLLSEYEIINVVGEAVDAKSTMKQIQDTNPEVIFLDIQMPGETGLTLAEKIPPEIKIVFVTAYDEHAIRAFEINALDYLTKPVYPERLETTISRLIQEEEPVESEREKLTYEDFIFVKLNKSVKFIKLNTIICICSAKEYTQVYTNDGSKGLILLALSEWEAKLPSNQFIRIHRSTIININCVSKIEPWFNNSYKIFMKGIAEPLMMSRRYVSKIKDKFGLQ